MDKKVAMIVALVFAAMESGEISGQQREPLGVASFRDR